MDVCALFIQVSHNQHNGGASRWLLNAPSTIRNKQQISGIQRLINCGRTNDCAAINVDEFFA